MSPRKILFWTHLVAGIAAGAVVFLMSVTGVALTYERQLEELARSDYRTDAAARGERPLESGRLYVDRYTGAVLGDGSGATSAFFGLMVSWHRWLGQEGDGRAVGRAVTGACNLAFLFLIVSGAYLWWPRNWSSRARAAPPPALVMSWEDGSREA